MDFLFLVIGLLVGGTGGYFVIRAQISKQKQVFQEEFNKLEKEKADRLVVLDKEKSILEEKVSTLRVSNESLTEEVNTERNSKEEHSKRLAAAEVEFKNLREKLDNQAKEMADLQKKFNTEFENIANKILKQNTKEFTEVSQKNMGELLNPLKEKIQTFEKKVDDTYHKGLKDQTDLRAELKKLYDLNSRISQEANNLTRALKSDSKKQGNWGEIVLERVLERSGLVKGQEYETQVMAKNEEGKTIYPDVIVKLPDEKHIIIDSKVSLVAYEAFVNEDDPEKKESYLKQHVDSIKTHVKGLNEKNYQNAALFDSPDFVLLFMPIESAFSAAIQADINLFQFAWDKKIVMVSPTTLLATLRTIESIWKHEKQTQNAIEIARQGGALYDKFEGFVSDLAKIGGNLDTTKKNYDAAMNKLKTGKGNLVRSTQKLKDLGAKATKSLPGTFFEENND
jgi:DNA recombination protein RmuC